LTWQTTQREKGGHIEQTDRSGQYNSRLNKREQSRLSFRQGLAWCGYAGRSKEEEEGGFVMEHMNGGAGNRKGFVPGTEN